MNIVILHGWGHSASMWQSFASKFSEDKVIILDLPGFGDEKLISHNWTVKDYATWVTKKLKNKKLNDVVLVGHSFGGKIAIEITAANPDIVAKLILVAAPALRRPTFATKLKILSHKITKKVLLKNSLNIFFNDEYKSAHENNLGQIFKNSVNYDATDKLPTIKKPTLMIWGEEDHDAPVAIAREMHKLIKNSKLVVLKLTGHNIYLTNPNILFGVVNKFIHD